MSEFRQIPQPRDWKSLERHSEGADRADMDGTAWDNFVDGLKRLGNVGDRPIVLYEKKVLVGWQFQRASVLLDIKPVYVAPPENVTSEELVQILEDNRRHEQNDVIAVRRERVAALRASGASLRTIADQENISVTTVLRDLDEVTVPGGGTVTPENGKIIGKDGREQPAKKPKSLCKNCERKIRTGQELPKQCGDCKDLRDEIKAERAAEREEKRKAKESERLKHEAERAAKEDEVKELKDAVGHVVPKHLVSPFSINTQFEAVDSLLRQVQKQIHEISVSAGGEDLLRFVKSHGADDKKIYKSDHLNNLKRDLKHTRPHSICPYCEGKTKPDCKGCAGKGWITKTTWDDAESAVKARLE